MSKRTCAAVLVAACSLVATSSASAGGWSPPPTDTVYGSGNNNHPTVENGFSIAAGSLADGTKARGFFEFHGLTNPRDVIIADIKCLAVSGRFATVVGRILYNRNTAGSNLVGRYHIVRLEDGGPGSQDEIRNQLLPPGTPQPACPTPADITPSRGLSSGDITITDS
jgi:hypothetical protein